MQVLLYCHTRKIRGNYHFSNKIKFQLTAPEASCYYHQKLAICIIGHHLSCISHWLGTGLTEGEYPDRQQTASHIRTLCLPENSQWFK